MQPDRSVADQLCRYIDDAPSPFHAVEASVSILGDAGSRAQGRAEAWDPEPGLRHCRVGGALVAWWQPARPPSSFRIVGAHTDSPNLRLKERPDFESAGIRQVGVEVYGGALLNSWLDRDLGLSGRVVARSDAGPHVSLVRIDEPLLRVPQLAIHLDRDVVTDGLKLNPQTHLAPMWDLAGSDGLGAEGTILDMVAAAAGCDRSDLLAWDLMAHDVVPARRTGRDGIFLSAPRLDNLCSAFAATTALAASAGTDADVVPVVCLYDHEEVGSTSSTGADSSLLPTVLERVVDAAGGSRDDLHRALAASVCVSADMAHGTHPNYPDRHEPQHQIALNGGITIKVNANQRYASDATTIALVTQVCDDAGIPTQRYVHRTDLPCGSTIGPVTAARLGIPTVDVGVAQLAMHSARELAGADDPSYYSAFLAAFLRG